MNKGLLLIAAAAVLVIADAAANCCRRSHCRRSCDVVAEAPVVAYATAPAFVAEAEPAAPLCRIACLTYKNVPAIRHVSYSCPQTCIVGDEGVVAHTAKLQELHNAEGVTLEVR